VSGTTWIGSKVYDMETSDDARSQLDNLIVEAEPSVQGLLSRCLIDDYRVLTASSGQAATDMLEVGGPVAKEPKLHFSSDRPQSPE